ncbi:MAG: penicillin-insensitive murein endopeptidase [Polyangiales bacterium]
MPGCSTSEVRAAPGAATDVITSKIASKKTEDPALIQTAPQPQAADVGATVQGTATPTVTEQDTASTAAVLALAGSQSTSIGGPGSGQVRGSVPFPDAGRGFYHNPVRPYEARYGTVELVQSIVRAAARVDETHPGSVLVVNDLGLIEGGPIAHHGSHQAGRDADILFYSVDAQGKSLPSVGVPIDPQGKGVDFKNLADPADDQPVALDVPRTWAFAAALIEVAQDNLQRIFVVEHVRNMLLAEAARVHAPATTLQRFAELTCQPEYPHDDHFHIRLYCTPEDMALGCRDSLPTYPFRTAALSALGLSPLIASARTPVERKARNARTVSHAEAKKQAGPMHAAVTQFLKQREAWLKKPSPGRRYCP